jgi:hypothetical protein
MLQRLLCAAVIEVIGLGVAMAGSGANQSKTAIKIGLTESWTRSVEVPPLKDTTDETLLTGATLRLAVEKGWLLVDRQTPSGDLEWKVVLARADDPRPPEVQVDKSKAISAALKCKAEGIALL